MAYLVDLDHKCDRCKHNRAVQALFNNINSLMGHYCADCAKIKKAEQQTKEDARAAAEEG